MIKFMGTRADFYVGCGPSAEWLGSVAFDGYPSGMPKALLTASTEAEFRAVVEKELSGRSDATYPADGWPWPWENSGLTDYSYNFDGFRTYVAHYGRGWGFGEMIVDEEPKDWHTPMFTKVVYPDMTDKQNVTFGERSGALFLKG